MESIESMGIVEWLPENMETYFHTMYSTAVYERYKRLPGIHNVSVVNMHYDAANFDSTEAFCCDHLDEAPHACEVAKSREKENFNNLSASSRWMDWMLFRERFKRNNSIGLAAVEDERWERIEEKFYILLDKTNAPKICLPNNLKEQLQEVLDTPGPCLVDCQIIKDENCYPMVAPGKSNSQMIGISKQSTPVT